MIELDGSIGEGGGQILRNAVALAALMGEELRVYNIRAKRNPPGLRPQHLTAVKAVAELCRAEVRGLSVGSTEILFKPNEIRGGKFVFDAGTAGSTTLMLQSLLPVMCFADGKVEMELRGGTNNPLAPPIEYVKMVLLPTLKKMGVRAEVELVKRGFYPRGGGVIRARTEPCTRLMPIELLEVGKVDEVVVYAYSCNLPSHIVERISRRCEELLRSHGIVNVEVIKEVSQRGDPLCSLDPGTGVILVARSSTGALIGSDCLGERGVPSEVIAERAVKELVSQLHEPVDKHLGDQLVIWVALASGRSVYRVSELTMHAVTSIDIVQRMTSARFDVEGEVGGPATITCQGIGLAG